VILTHEICEIIYPQKQVALQYALHLLAHPSRSASLILALKTDQGRELTAAPGALQNLWSVFSRLENCYTLHINLQLGIDKSILPYHRSPAPYTRELSGVEYLLKQNGGEPPPFLNETEEAEGKEEGRQ